MVGLYASLHVVSKKHHESIHLPIQVINGVLREYHISIRFLE